MLKPETSLRSAPADFPWTEDLQDVLTALVADEVRDGPHLRISYELGTSDRVVAALDPTSQHYAASTMKLPLVLAAYRLRDRGTLDLDSTVTVHNSFTSRTGGPFSIDPDEDSDEEVWAALGTEVPLRWLCRRSIIRSSNLATNLVADAVGFDAVAEVIADCNATGVEVVRGIEDYAAQRAGISNVVTVSGLNRILLALADGTVAEASTCAEVLGILADNQVDTDIRPGLPPGTWVAHKNGWVSDGVLDAALVRPGGAADPDGQFVFSVAISGVWPNERAHELIQRLAGTVWDRRSGSTVG
ncbi:serine hydrolase [Microlunatus sp. Gsoil 973]|uniref:serine hydrolase n=1 Tax=Microlunatus sp. Gsoil 973 TaxID=2672569 RepID=UPI0018A81BBC|nr:serine hydrolase [Microlunatus sp. Gsoil 973]